MKSKRQPIRILAICCALLLFLSITPQPAHADPVVIAMLYERIDRLDRDRQPAELIGEYAYYTVPGSDVGAAIAAWGVPSINPLPAEFSPMEANIYVDDETTRGIGEMAEVEDIFVRGGRRFTNFTFDINMVPSVFGEIIMLYEDDGGDMLSVSLGVYDRASMFIDALQTANPRVVLSGGQTYYLMESDDLTRMGLFYSDLAALQNPAITRLWAGLLSSNSVSLETMEKLLRDMPAAEAPIPGTQSIVENRPMPIIPPIGDIKAQAGDLIALAIVPTPLEGYDPPPQNTSRLVHSHEPAQEDYHFCLVLPTDDTLPEALAPYGMPLDLTALPEGYKIDAARLYAEWDTVPDALYDMLLEAETQFDWTMTYERTYWVVSDPDMQGIRPQILDLRLRDAQHRTIHIRATVASRWTKPVMALIDAAQAEGAGDITTVKVEKDYEGLLLIAADSGALRSPYMESLWAYELEAQTVKAGELVELLGILTE